ncbi:MAG: hypothetical protein HY532_01310 [Chloroflexi bacterium]|nr:hypothetical protein [Chloroflexota bacterium]
MLSEALQDVLRHFFTEHAQFKEFLQTIEHQALEEHIIGILNVYANDKNSSTLRAYISLALAGYTPSLKKHEADGQKTVEGISYLAEAKPRNYDPEQDEENGDNKPSKPRKLNWGR